MFFKQGSYILLVTSTWQHGKQNGHNSLRFWGERKCQCQLRRRTRGVDSRAFFLRWNSTNVVWWINGLKEAIGLSMFFPNIDTSKSWGWKHGAVFSPIDKTVAATQICFSLSPRALGKWWRAYFSKCFYNFKHGWNFSYGSWSSFSDDSGSWGPVLPGHSCCISKCFKAGVIEWDPCWGNQTIRQIYGNVEAFPF